MLSNDEAWKRLPGASESPRPLPAWARMLAGPLPLTTARMLELDALHRTGDRLDARFRAVARWAAADANGCAYSKAVAVADFARSGAGGDLKELAGHPDQLPALDRAVVGFARKMMRESHAVTDAEVKQLLNLAGEERVVALVALLAHASFQDRVLLAIGVPEEPGGGPPPLTVRFSRPRPKEAAPPPPAPATAPASGGSSPAAGPKWTRLQAGLERQRARSSRIRVPSREEVLNRLGENHPAAWQAGILWSRVCYGYQPELTDAWFDCSGAFRQETDLDRFLQNSVFWVVTESQQCFY
jgi:alkylhydroperoxidase family enzyme